jgi:hypothetical protein
MGKSPKQYTYAAYQENGLWIGTVVEDARLKVPGKSEEDAMKQAEAAHNELLRDKYYIAEIARQEARKWQTN